MTAFADISSLDLQKIWDGVHGRSIHGERLTLGVIELDPDSHVPEHQHENEQLGICLSGSLRFRVGDEEVDIRPGGTWTIPSNVPHEVHVGPDGAVVLDVFNPPREEWREAPRVEQRATRWP
jgi:quercetin dioxygenase-like cupin family protein